MNTSEIIESIKNGTNELWSYEHFHSSNMADYTLMSCTISDLVGIYGIDEAEAVDIIQALTH